MWDSANVRGKKICLIINPKAGHQVSQIKSREIMELLQRRGCDVKLFYTEYSKHAMEIVRDNCGKADIFVCCGGDGTLNEVITAVMIHAPEIPIGYIPSGTTNDFAVTAGLSKLTPKAVKTVTDGCISTLDVGHIADTDKYFLYIASFGAFTSASYATPQEVKNVFGHAAYVFDGIRSLKDIKPHYARIKTDDGEIIGEYAFGSITNSMSVGGVFSFKKDDVCLNDGKFELLLVKKPENPQQIGEMMHMLLSHEYDGDRVKLVHSSHVEIEFDEEQSFTADGEFAGNYKKIVIDNISKAIKIYTPSEL